MKIQTQSIGRSTRADKYFLHVHQLSAVRKPANNTGQKMKHLEMLYERSKYPVLCKVLSFLWKNALQYDEYVEIIKKTSIVSNAILQ